MHTINYLGVILVRNTGLKQISASSSSIMKNTIDVQTNMVLLQFHISLFSNGSSVSRISDASYISGIPPPE